MSKKIAIHCKTQAESNRLMRAYDKKMWKWCSGNKPTQNEDWWSVYKEGTYVEFKDSFGYGDKNSYIIYGKTIITVSQAIKKLNPKLLCKEKGCKNQAWTKNHCRKHQVKVLNIPNANFDDKSPLLEEGDTFIYTKEMNEAKARQEYNNHQFNEVIGSRVSIYGINKHSQYSTNKAGGLDFKTVDDHLLKPKWTVDTTIKSDDGITVKKDTIFIPQTGELDLSVAKTIFKQFEEALAVHKKHFT